MGAPCLRVLAALLAVSFAARVVRHKSTGAHFAGLQSNGTRDSTDHRILEAAEATAPEQSVVALAVARLGRLERSWPSLITKYSPPYFAQSFYHLSVLPMLLATVVLAYAARPSNSECAPPGFRRFQLKYLLVWSCCAAADWLQGPYVYALYAAYGFTSQEIARLYVAGFASSMVSGCLVGTFADRFGRRRCCILYCILYIASCLTKHVKQYYVLMIGRIIGGVATSILFSCFECWMVSEHQKRHRFSDSLLGYMFGMMFTAMYCVAIMSGLLGQVVADAFVFQPVFQGMPIYTGGYCCPFDLAIVFLCVGMVFILALWEENHGHDAGESVGIETSMVDNLRSAGQRLIADPRCGLLCMIVSAFEGSMYAFIFNWTPALESETTPTPHGLIFSLFMMACSCGSSAATLATGQAAPTSRLVWVFAMGLGAFVLASSGAASHTDSSLQLMFVAFLLFEFCVGVYFPSIGILKSEVVPEQVRSTMYNIFRVPVNGIVVALLLSGISMTTCFKLNAVLLLMALVGVLALEGTFGTLTSALPKPANAALTARAV